MEKSPSFLSRIRSLATGRARWGIAAVLVIAAPLLVVAAVRKGADAPKPETSETAPKAEKSRARVSKDLAPVIGGGSALEDPEALKALAAIVAEPQAEETLFDDTEMVAALDAAVEADQQQSAGSGPSVDAAGGGAAAPVASAQLPESNGKDKDKKKKEKKTTPPGQRSDRSRGGSLEGAFEGGRDPNMSALESAVEIEDNKEEIEQEEECKQGSDDPECNPAAVPLPASLPLLAAGAAALGFFRRRRRKEV
jgi:hypothetical protein